MRSGATSHALLFASPPLAFDECHELCVADLAGLHVHFDGQQEREQRLVLLVQAAGAVPPQLVSQVVDDVLYSLRGRITLLRPGNRRAT